MDAMALECIMYSTGLDMGSSAAAFNGSQVAMAALRNTTGAPIEASPSFTTTELPVLVNNNNDNSSFTGDGATPTGMLKHDPLLSEIKHYLTSVVSPLLCSVGLVGNILNILVLTRRRLKASVDCSMERAAYMGLLALAVSDFLYCLCTLPAAFFSRTQVMFTSRDFWLYYTMVGRYLQNVFSHISTWLTVIMAGGRYAAICHPLHARQFVHAKGTRLGIVLTFLIWSGLGLPVLWAKTVYDVPCADGSVIYVVDNGEFTMNPSLRTTFTYIWTVAGFIVPVGVLAYCNAHLIRALRESYEMRKEYRVHGRSPGQQNTRITPTLVAIVIMFLALVSPSEIVQFVFYAVEGAAVEHVTLAIVITNLLHTLNFAVNFVLYCCVNSHFRNTLMDVFCLHSLKRRRLDRNCTYTATYSNVTSRSYAAPAPSTETIL